MLRSRRLLLQGTCVLAMGFVTALVSPANAYGAMCPTEYYCSYECPLDDSYCGACPPEINQACELNGPLCGQHEVQVWCEFNS